MCIDDQYRCVVQSEPPFVLRSETFKAFNNRAFTMWERFCLLFCKRNVIEFDDGVLITKSFNGKCFVVGEYLTATSDSPTSPPKDSALGPS